MIKRILSIVIIITLCLNGCCALAEEKEDKGLLSSVGAFLSDAWDSIREKSGTAYEGASGWISDTWGDASKWVGQTWEDSSAWVSDIWGDASTWTQETYDTVSNAVGLWWVGTLDTVLKTAEQPWDWLSKSAAMLDAKGRKIMRDIEDVLADPQNEAVVRTVFMALLKKLGIDTADATRIWNTLKTYAERHELSPLVVLKLALPYLGQLAIDCIMAQKSGIPPIVVAQYLLTTLEKLGIDTDQLAQNLLTRLIDTLSGI